MVKRAKERRRRREEEEEEYLRRWTTSDQGSRPKDEMMRLIDWRVAGSLIPFTEKIAFERKGKVVNTRNMKGGKEENGRKGEGTREM